MNCRKNSVGNSNKETTIPILLERYLPTLNEKKKSAANDGCVRSSFGKKLN